METTPYMTLNTDFSGIRVMDTFMVPCRWDIEVDLMAVETDKEDARTVRALGYQSLIFWLSELLDTSLFVYIRGDNSRAIFEMTNNNLVTLPAMPTDDLIAMVLSSKIESLVDDFGLSCLGVRLKSSDSKMTFHYSSSEAPDLPNISYAGDEAKMFKKPWWSRKDSSTSDMVDYDDNGLVVIPINSPSSDPLHAFIAALSETMGVDSPVKGEVSSATVLTPEWKKK